MFFLNISATTVFLPSNNETQSFLTAFLPCLGMAERLNLHVCNDEKALRFNNYRFTISDSTPYNSELYLVLQQSLKESNGSREASDWIGFYGGYIGSIFTAITSFVILWKTIQANFISVR